MNFEWKAVVSSCDGKKSYTSVYNSDGTPYSGFISVTAVAFGN